MLIADEALRGSSFGREPRTPSPLRRRPKGHEGREIHKTAVLVRGCHPKSRVEGLEVSLRALGTEVRLKGSREVLVVVRCV